MAENSPKEREHPNAETSKPSKAETSRSPKSVLLRKDGRRLKRMTLYLPVDLARRLAHHCVERDSDVSAITAQAISHYLTFSK